MKRVVIIVLGAVALVFFMCWCAWAFMVTHCSEPTQKLVEFYGGDQSYPCTLPEFNSAWFLAFQGADVLKGKNTDIEVIIINTSNGDVGMNNDNSAASHGVTQVAPNEKFLVYQGGLDKLIAPILYVRPSLSKYPGPINFILQMKTKGHLESPVVVTAEGPDGL